MFLNIVFVFVFFFFFWEGKIAASNFTHDLSLLKAVVRELNFLDLGIALKIQSLSWCWFYNKN